MSIVNLLREVDAIITKPNLRTGKPGPPAPHNLQFAGTGLPGRRESTTAIVALKCKNAVVMGSDRLMTNGWEVSSRLCEKLDEIDDFSVLGQSGFAAFGMEVTERLGNACEVIAKRNKRPVSFEGKSRLLRDVVLAVSADMPWFWFPFVPYGGILGSWDKHEGASIVSAQSDGGIYPADEDFEAEGSGAPSAKTYMRIMWEKNLSIGDATDLAIGAVVYAGWYTSSVSHPRDPLPRIKIITSAGTIDVEEKEVGNRREKILRNHVPEYVGRVRQQKGGLS